MIEDLKKKKITKVPTLDGAERRRKEGIVEGIPEARYLSEERIKKFKKQGYIPVREGD
jgi:hypothetical protein